MTMRPNRRRKIHKQENPHSGMDPATGQKQGQPGKIDGPPLNKEFQDLGMLRGKRDPINGHGGAEIIKEHGRETGRDEAEAEKDPARIGRNPLHVPAPGQGRANQEGGVGKSPGGRNEHQRNAGGATDPGPVGAFCPDDFGNGESGHQRDELAQGG